MGIRQTWVYPSDGSPPYEKGSYVPHNRGASFPTIMPDLPDFVSSVDGQRYSGRAGMREHNLKHNVVPVSDLAGLPYLTTSSDQRSSEEKRQSAEHRKQTIINQVNKHYK